MAETIEYRGFSIEVDTASPQLHIHLYKDGLPITIRPIPVKDMDEAREVVDEAIEDGLVEA